MEGSARALGFALGVEGASFIERLGVDCDDRVELRAGFFVGVDAGEEERREFFRGERAGGHRRLEFSDGGISERDRRGAAAEREGEDEREEEVGRGGHRFVDSKERQHGDQCSSWEEPVACRFRTGVRGAWKNLR